MFGFHFLLCGITLILSLVQLTGSGDCQIKNQFLGTSLAISIVFIVSAFFVMWINLYFGLKFAHLGCNIIWTFLWIQCSYCGYIIIAVIGIIHGVLSITGLISFVITNFMRKTSTTAKCWKAIYVISVVFMIFCYVASFIGGPMSKDCSPAYLFFLTYQKYGAI